MKKLMLMAAVAAVSFTAFGSSAQAGKYVQVAECPTVEVLDVVSTKNARQRLMDHKPRPYDEQIARSSFLDGNSSGFVVVFGDGKQIFYQDTERNRAVMKWVTSQNSVSAYDVPGYYNDTCQEFRDLDL